MLYTVNLIEEKKNLEGVRYMKNFKFNKITIKIKLLTIFLAMFHLTVGFNKKSKNIDLLSCMILMRGD